MVMSIKRKRRRRCGARESRMRIGWKYEVVGKKVNEKKEMKEEISDE